MAMESYSHIIEIKQFMDKCLVCDIQVQDISISVPGLQIHTNKWLHLEDWLEIDTGIESLLERFRKSETFDGFETELFYLGAAIRVDCQKIRMSRAHKKILGLDKEYFPIALGVRVTKINTKALIDQINSFEEKLNGLTEKTTSVLKVDDNKLVQCENLREYDPTAHNNGAEQPSSDYVPYTASAKTPTIDTPGSAVSEDDPYSPKPVSIESSPDQISESPSEIPTYKPARIELNKCTNVQDEISENLDNQQAEERPPSMKVLRRRRSPVEETKSKSSTSRRLDQTVKRPSKKTKTMNAELFGSDDSDQEQLAKRAATKTAEAGGSPKRVATPMRTPSTTDRLHQERTRKRLKLGHESTSKSSLDGWLSKSSIKDSDKSNGKSVKKSLRHKQPVENKSENSKFPSPDELMKNQDLVEKQQIKELSALRDKIKSKKKSPPPVMDILTLKHLSSEDILGTFKGIEPILDDIFKTYSKKTKITGFSGINHMMTLMLIDDKKQIQMMNFLRDNYQPDEKGVPSLTDLYINALVPEWTVNVFMKEFNFTRTEAIERLQAQEESSLHHNKESLDSFSPI